MHCNYRHKRTEPVSFTGAEVNCLNILSIACPKIKWFCPNITWIFFLPREGGGGSPPPPPPASYAYGNRCVIDKLNKFLIYFSLVDVLSRIRVCTFFFVMVASDFCMIFFLQDLKSFPTSTLSCKNYEFTTIILCSKVIAYNVYKVFIWWETNQLISLMSTVIFVASCVILNSIYVIMLVVLILISLRPPSWLYMYMLTRWRRFDFAITHIPHRPKPEYTRD